MKREDGSWAGGHILQNKQMLPHEVCWARQVLKQTRSGESDVLVAEMILFLQGMHSLLQMHLQSLVGFWKGRNYPGQSVTFDNASGGLTQGKFSQR